VILDQHIEGKIVRIEVEGEPGSAATLEFVVWGYELKEVKGGTLSQDGEQGFVAFEFPTTMDRYARHSIEIALR
jgi:hypothetical protein